MKIYPSTGRAEALRERVIEMRDHALDRMPWREWRGHSARGGRTWRRRRHGGAGEHPRGGADYLVVKI
jgi:hypothetical protein